VLIFGLAMMYKAIRVETLDRWPREVAMMVGQVLLAFFGFAVGLYVVVQMLVPLLPAG
jgi:tetrahydromethanopterin S-methyltransferase subunit B